MFVPQEVWVTANFKETRLDLMRAGRPVDIAVDAFPDRAFRGHVDSIQAGSGTCIQPSPGRERDWQLHQGRSTHSGENCL
jgi:membrane fusion protein (multidrug efflux system)